jgi:hypothetical protein
LTIDVEGLMTNKHTVSERTPSEVFGRGKPTITKELAVIVHNVSVAVEDRDG